tara:strand:- start:3083 stop:12598 length:9516 start_codon:yes stop_codon:yes gene_type:complete
VSGDTLIATKDWGFVKIQNLCELDPEQKFEVLSYDVENNCIATDVAYHARKTKTDKTLILRFKNRSSLQCTYDHLILCSDNEYRHAQDLNIGDAIHLFSFENTTYPSKCKDYDGPVDYFQHKAKINTITSIEESNEIDVYDLTTTKFHNFGVAKQVNGTTQAIGFIHNSYGTYDRLCVALSTKIAIPSPGGYLTLKELIKKYPNDERFIIYTYDKEQKKIVPAWAHHPRSSGIMNTVKIIFNDDSYIISTPDHKHMMRDSSFREARDLKPGDSMMPFYRKQHNDRSKKDSHKFSGYKNIYTMSNGSYRGWESEHKIIAEWFNNQKVKKHEEVVYHIDRNLENNNSNNLQLNHTIKTIIPWEAVEVGDLTVDGYENFATDTIICHNSRYADYCLAPDTEVYTTRGIFTIKELAEKYSNGKRFNVWSYDHSDGTIKIGEAHSARLAKNGKEQQLVRVYFSSDGSFDENSYIDSTLDHKFLLRDGSECEAQYLEEGQALMPFYTRSGKHSGSKHYRAIYTLDNLAPMQGWVYEHRAHVEYFIRSLKKDEIVHHKDFNKHNNLIENLEIMNLHEHHKYHAQLNNVHKFNKPNDTHSKWMFKNNPTARKDINFDRILKVAIECDFQKKKVKEILLCDHNVINRCIRKKGFKNWIHFAKNKDNIQKFITDFNLVKEQKSCTIDNIKSHVKENDSISDLAIRLGCSTNAIRRRLTSANCGTWTEFKANLGYKVRIKDLTNKNKRGPKCDETLTYQMIYDAYKQGMTYKELAEACNTSQNKVMTRIKNMGHQSYKDFCDNYKNHKVSRIVLLDTKHQVYNLTVDKFHNFAAGKTYIDSDNKTHNYMILLTNSEMEYTPELSSGLDIYCLAGDNIIPLVNGDRLTIKELYDSKRTNFEVYSYNTKQHKYATANCKQVIMTGKDQQIWRVNLSDGTHIRATDKHLFLSASKSSARGEDLTVFKRVSQLARFNKKIQYIKSIFIPERDADLSFDNEKNMLRGVTQEELEKYKTFFSKYIPFVSDELEAMNKESIDNLYITSIEPDGIEDVYDLTVEETHNFAISSQENNKRYIFVHNSDEVCASDERGRIVHIYSDNQRVRELLEHLFYDTLNVEFSMHSWIRNLPVRDTTPIPLFDGRTITIEALAEEYKQGKENWVYSVQDKTQQLVPGKVTWCGMTRENSELIRTWLDDDTYVDTTPDHEFIMRDGSKKRADELSLNDSLMPFYTENTDKSSRTKHDRLNGYEKVYNPCSDEFEYTSEITTKRMKGVDTWLPNIAQTAWFERAKKKSEIGCDNLKNHKVLYTERLQETANVYCMTVVGPNGERDRHNFAVKSLIKNSHKASNYGILLANCKYGDFFLFNDVHTHYGIVNTFPIPVNEIEREEGYDPEDPLAVRFRWVTQGNQVLENWMVTHFRLLGNDNFLPYGSSVIEPARRIWRQLILIEDAMMVYRIIRSPERRVFYIDVGNINPDDVPTYLEKVRTSLKRQSVINTTTGRVDLRYNPLCHSMNNIIYLQDGRAITLGEFINEWDNGKQDQWVYSVDADSKKLVPGKVIWAGMTRKNAQLVRIHLDNGKWVDCTPDHKQMLRDGTYIESQDLQPGDKLMPFHMKLSSKNPKGYIEWHNPYTGKYKFAHRIIAENISSDERKLVHANTDWNDTRYKYLIIHHKDFNKLNNNPDNLVWMNNVDHSTLHGFLARKNITKYNKSKKKRERTSTLNKQRNSTKAMAWYNGSDLHKEHNVIRREAQKRVWSNETEKTRRKKKMTTFFDKTIWDALSKEIKNNRIKTQNDAINFINDNLIDYLISINDSQKLRNYRKITKPLFKSKLNNICFDNFKSFKEAVNNGYEYENHSVVKVEWLKEREDTGCITVEKWHNFATGGSIECYDKDELDIGVSAQAFGIITKNSVDEDYFIPIRGDASTKIETLAGGQFPVRRDTRVPLLDGRILTIEEAAREYESGKENWVYSIHDNDSSIVPGKIAWAGLNYTCDKIHRVWLDDGSYVDMAPEHPVVMRDGTTKQTNKLISGDSVMPFKLKESSKEDSLVGYKMVCNPADDEWQFVHRFVANDIGDRDKAILRSNENSCVIHHVDFNKLNNSPQNLKWMGFWEHRQLHIENLEKNFLSPEAIAKRKASHASDDYRELVKSRIADPDDKLHKWIYGENRERLIKRNKSHKMRMKTSTRNSERWNDPIFREQHSGKNHWLVKKWSKLYSQHTPDELREFCITHKIKYFNDLLAHPDRFYDSPAQFRKFFVHHGIRCWTDFSRDYLELAPQNHIIDRVEVLDIIDDVYCMTVLGPNDEDDRHNFAILGQGIERPTNILDGIFVKNTGDIEDVEYIQKKLFAAIKIPRAYLGYDEDLCASGDTEIRLLDGRSMCINELAKKFDHLAKPDNPNIISDPGNSVWIYTSSPDGTITPGRVGWCGKTKEVNKLIRITLDNGKIVECTHNHPFMLRDGTYKRADKLSSGDSLMPGYRRVSDRSAHDVLDGYEMILDNKTNEWRYVHQLVAQHCDVNIHESAGNEAFDVIHHTSFNKLNNNPDKLMKMGNKAHVKLHVEHLKHTLHRPDVKEKTQKILNEGWRVSDKHRQISAKQIKHATTTPGEPLYEWIHGDKISGVMSDVLKARWKDPEYRAFKSKQNKECWDRPEYRNKLSGDNHWMRKKYADYDIDWLIDFCIENEITERSYFYKNKNPDAPVGHKYIMSLLRRNGYERWREFKNKNIKPILDKKKLDNIFKNIVELFENVDNRLMTHTEVANKLGVNKGYITGAVKQHNFKGFNDFAEQRYNVKYIKISKTETKRVFVDNKHNHKVVLVEEIILDEAIPMFDLMVLNENHNFLLEVGVFCGNSGKATLAQEDIRFSRTITRIQKIIVSELNKVAMIHLAAHGFEGQDLINFKIALSNPSTAAQQQKLELWRSRFEIATSAPDGLFSKRWLHKNLFLLDDKEIESIKEELISEREEELELEQVGQESEFGPPGGEGEGGTAPPGEEELSGIMGGDEEEKKPPQLEAGIEHEWDIIAPSVNRPESLEEIETNLNKLDERPKGRLRRGRPHKSLSYGVDGTEMPDMNNHVDFSDNDVYDSEFIRNIGKGALMDEERDENDEEESSDKVDKFFDSKITSIARINNQVESMLKNLNTSLGLQPTQTGPQMLTEDLENVVTNLNEAINKSQDVDVDIDNSEKDSIDNDE